MPDSLIKEHSDAYMQLATLQTKLNEDDYIIAMLQCDSADKNTALALIRIRRESLSRELRKVKENIVDIESKWRG